MARLPAGPLVQSLIVPTLLLAAVSGPVEAADITKPEVRLGIANGPHIETIDEVEVTDKHSYAIAPGAYIDLPLTTSRLLGVVLGVALPYRFGTSNFDDKDRTKISSDLVGGQVEVGLSLHLGTSVIVESLGVFGYGHAHVWYAREGYHNNDYGSYSDFAWKFNVLFAEPEAGAKVGISLAYDVLRLRLRDGDENTYGTKANGLAFGFVGSLSF